MDSLVRNIFPLEENFPQEHLAVKSNSLTVTFMAGKSETSKQVSGGMTGTEILAF